jgi:hypothetical protein
MCDGLRRGPSVLDGSLPMNGSWPRFSCAPKHPDGDRKSLVHRSENGAAMGWKRATGFCGALLAFSTAACGGNTASSSSAGPNLDSANLLIMMSNADRGTLCDWLAQQEGGYGHVTTCDASGVPLEADADQATCVGELSMQATLFPACPATVGQYVSCVQWFLQNWCSATASMPAECMIIQSDCEPGGSPLDAGSD